jgi:hypothetical protein
MLDDKKIKELDHQVYRAIPLNDLVTYSVYYLTQINERTSTENIAVVAFLLLLFPTERPVGGLFPEEQAVCLCHRRLPVQG